MDFQEDINRAIQVMETGGIILYPTDTVWGIGCDATNPEAVKKVYELKQRADSKSLIILLESLASVKHYVAPFDEQRVQQELNKANKPTTIIYQGAKNLAQNAVASDGTVAFRITQETFSQQLCKSFGKPIVSTSANISGEATAKSFKDIASTILNNVNFAVAYGRNSEEASSSRIIMLKLDDTIQVIRD